MSRPPIALCGLALLIGVLGGTPIQATGNLETTNTAQTTILNRVWHANSIPVVWMFNDPTTVAGCNYSSTSAPPATLQPAILAGFTTWQDNPDSKIAFSFGGTTSIKNVGADGVNVITFCSSTSFPTGVLAITPSTALTAPQVVVAGGGCPAGKGIMPGTTFCFPVGSYPAGTIIDADIQFNTSNPSTSETTFSTGDPSAPANAGKFDVQAIAAHEEGHFEGLSHDPIPQSVMFAFIDDDPFSNGTGQRVLKRSDLATSSHYYPEASFGSNYGSITGFISLDGADADGVHVVAIDPNTMLGVTGRFSLSKFEDPAALGTEGNDFRNNGGGFYRIDGLPPGNYYVYVEYFDNTDPFDGRLLNRYNNTVGNSSVAIGCTPGATCSSEAGDVGFVPALTEFYNNNDSGNGGDGTSAGTSADNSDAATLVPVAAGSVTTGIDIAINIEPVNGQTQANRQNPTTRTTVVNDSFQGTDVVTAFLLNGGNDDFYAIRYPAASLPTPPYNIAEGLWARDGRNDQGYGVRLTFGDPNNASNPDLNNPVVAMAGRVLSGGPGGKTEAGDIIDVRDQWNVTINQSRDIWIVLNQPPSPPGISFLTSGYFILTTRTSAGAARVGRTRVSQDGGVNWATLSADVFYDLVLETTPPVRIASASPASAVEGQTLNVTVNGAGFQSGAVCDFGGGITVNSSTLLSATQVVCNVTIACTGAVANRDVNVEIINPGVVFPNVSRVLTVTPAVNDADCDGVVNVNDCAPFDAAITHAATEVTNDTVTLLDPLTIDYTWDSQDAANGTSTSYDVVTGLISDLRATGTYAAATCVANDQADTTYRETSALAPGAIRYWIVRSHNTCNIGGGTFGNSSLAPDPRDALDAGVACP